MNATVETKKNEVRNNIKNMLESATEKIKDIIAVCPDWRVRYVDEGCKASLVELKLQGVERDRRIYIHYQAKLDGWQEECFETNVAACGSFDLIEASDNLKYYTAVGDILNHKDMLSLLRETMIHYTEKIYELHKEYDKLDEED